MLDWLLRLFTRRRGSADPDQLIDAVTTDMRRKLTEARLQMLAADLARRESAAGSEVDAESHQATRHGIERLEEMLRELESRRSVLVARARDADARLAIERALMETDAEPARVALSLLAEQVSETKAEADAIAEVRQISGSGGADA